MRFRTRPSLIARLRNPADESAWRAFIEQYQPFIHRVGTDAGVPRGTLADMTQDVYLTVVRVLPRFVYDPVRGRFRAWLARVVRSRCGDLFRRRRREAVLQINLYADRPWPSETPRADELGSALPSSDTLREAMAIVSRSTRPSTWQCFQRHAMDGQRAAEVAKELGTTANAVYLNSTRLTRRIEYECRRLMFQEQGDEFAAMSR